MKYITDLKIANLALAKLGLKEISSFEQQEESARVVNSLYGQTLEHELSIYQWAFAVRRVSLPALSEPPAFGYAYQYALPEDFLRLESICNRGGEKRDAYCLENDKILTDIPAPLNIIYLSRNLEHTKWPPYFVAVFTTRLAYELCERLKQDPQRKNILWQEYQAEVAAAKRSNAIQLSIRRPLSVSWEDERNGF